MFKQAGRKLPESQINKMYLDKMENNMRLLGDLLKACHPLREYQEGAPLAGIFKDLWSIIERVI